MIDILKELEAAESTEDKAAIIAESILNDFPELTADAGLRCGFLPWFNFEFFKLLLDNQNRLDAAEEFNKIIDLPFVEEFQMGYAYHLSTHQGLLKKYREKNRQLIVTTFEKILPAVSKDLATDNLINLAVMGRIITGRYKQADKLINDMLDIYNLSGDIHRISVLFDTVNEANLYAGASRFVLKPEQVIERGRAYIRLGLYEEALNDFDLAIKIDPTYPRVYALKGDILRLSGRYDSAIENFNQAIALNPKDAWAYAHRGVANKKINKNEAAAADFSIAIDLEPAYAWALSNRAVIYRQLGRFKEALDDFSRAIKLDSGDAWTYSQRAITYRQIGRDSDALRDFNTALKIRRNDAFVIANRAIIYRRHGQLDRALKELNQAISLNEKYIWAVIARGETYRLLHKYPEALKDLNKAIHANPKDAWALLFRAETYRNLKNYKKALDDVNKVIRLEQSWDWAFYLRGLIQYSLDDPGAFRQNISQAIDLAELEYQKHSDNIGNILNLAIYHLVIGNETNARTNFEKVLSDKTAESHAYTAVTVLNEILVLFPKHALAREMLDKFQDPLLRVEIGNDQRRREKKRG